jgi:glyoxylase-like metal-dependent hydrolase (beta-lactamase superfamily II)
MTGPGTNTYVLGESELVVVDPGPANETHTAAIAAAAAPLGPIRTILVTHTHVDHAPGAAALAAASGARVCGFGPADGFDPDECVREGWSLTIPAPGEGFLTVRALHTPGHASDHLCWLVEEHALLLTGDHVMHGSTVVIRPPDGDLHQYLASLALVRDADPPIRTLAPGHGRLMDHVPEVIDALVAHRVARHERVVAVLTRLGDGTVDELLPEVYGDVTERQLPVARFSLWAHLRALAQEGRATCVATPPAEDPARERQAEEGEDEDTIESRWAMVP